MTAYAIIEANGWRELRFGHDIVIDGVASSYQTMLDWSSQMRTARGIKPIIEEEIPVGKRQSGSRIIDDNGVPRRIREYADLPQRAPALYAAARLKIEDYDITGIEVQSRFAGAFWIDVGKYCVFFAEPQPDTEYMAMASAGPCQAYVLEDEKDEAMFTITVTNAAGEPVEASFVNISIVRVS
jgi:hypothetical protein